jgi:hypothetical protein
MKSAGFAQPASKNAGRTMMTPALQAYQGSNSPAAATAARVRLTSTLRMESGLGWRSGQSPMIPFTNLGKRSADAVRGFTGESAGAAGV